MNEIGLAVIGAGYWGANLVRAARATPELRLRWVCDRDRDRLRPGTYGPARVTDSVAQVLDDPQVTAVAVATPAATHADVGRAALDAGRHVLVEKPLCTDRDRALELVRLAEARDLVLMCDHTYCYSPPVEQIRALIAAGELGDLHSYDSVRINLGPVRPDVDVLWDMVPHDLSILDLVLPPGVHPTSVSAHGTDPLRAGRAFTAHVTVRLSTGALAHIHTSWLSPVKVRTTAIGGSRATLLWDDLAPRDRLMRYDHRTGSGSALPLPDDEPLRRLMAEFASAVTEERAPLTDGRSGLRILDLLHAAGRSLELNGASVPVSPLVGVGS